MDHDQPKNPSTYSRTDRALVEAVKQDVLAELANRPLYRPSSGSMDQPYRQDRYLTQPSQPFQQGFPYDPERALVETVKQQVLAQIIYHTHPWSGAFHSYQPFSVHHPYPLGYPDPALVEAVKREVLAQMPPNRETPEPAEFDEQQSSQHHQHSLPRYTQPYYQEYYPPDPYLVEIIKHDVLRQLQSPPQSMAQ